MFVAACNRCGVTEGTEFAGHSALIAPDGTVLAEAGKDEEIIWADFDPEQVLRTRAQIPVFTDRMPELY
jgi:predicted amidohydrolase